MYLFVYLFVSSGVTHANNIHPRRVFKINMKKICLVQRKDWFIKTGTSRVAASTIRTCITSRYPSPGTGNIRISTFFLCTKHKVENTLQNHLSKKMGNGKIKTFLEEKLGIKVKTHGKTHHGAKAAGAGNWSGRDFEESWIRQYCQENTVNDQVETDDCAKYFFEDPGSLLIPNHRQLARRPRDEIGYFPEDSTSPSEKEKKTSNFDKYHHTRRDEIGYFPDDSTSPSQKENKASKIDKYHHARRDEIGYSPEDSTSPCQKEKKTSKIDKYHNARRDEIGHVPQDSISSSEEEKKSKKSDKYPLEYQEYSQEYDEYPPVQRKKVQVRTSSEEQPTYDTKVSSSSKEKEQKTLKCDESPPVQRKKVQFRTSSSEEQPNYTTRVRKSSKKKEQRTDECDDYPPGDVNVDIIYNINVYNVHEHVDIPSKVEQKKVGRLRIKPPKEQPKFKASPLPSKVEQKKVGRLRIKPPKEQPKFKAPPPPSQEEMRDLHSLYLKDLRSAREQ